jgi:carbon monoxide dehydrogenase subunit G
MRVEESIEIARSQQEVWQFIADPTNDPRWCSKVKSVEPAGDLRWKVIHKPVPLRPAVALTVEHTELEPPVRLRMREEDNASVFVVEYRLADSGGGTRLTQVSDFEWKRLPRILHRTFSRGVQRDVQAQLRALKGVLEAPR